MKFLDAFLRVFLTKIERNYLQKCKIRPALSDDEFIATYYSECPFSAEIPLRIRKVFREQEKCYKVIPTDTVWEMSDDIPFVELMQEIAEEFDIDISISEIEDLNGSFDSIVRLVAKKYGGVEKRGQN